MQQIARRSSASLMLLMLTSPAKPWSRRGDLHNMALPL